MRVFAGLPLPPSMQDTLKNILEVLKTQYRGLKTVAPGNLHFTVYFFGELDSQEINGLSSIMEDPELHVDKIQANFKGYSQFPEKGNPRVIHLELDQGKEPVIEVNRKFLEKLHKQGLDRPEGNKKFIPHLTLCRNREEKIKPGFIDSLSIPNGPFVLDRLVLFKSVLKPGGAEYSPLKTIEFR